jgi:IS30 family transposase
MRKRQGQQLSEEQIAKVQRLLAETDMTIGEIAERLLRSKSVISAINRKFAIRIYSGRSQWLVNSEWQPPTRQSA